MNEYSHAETKHTYFGHFSARQVHPHLKLNCYGEFHWYRQTRISICSVHVVLDTTEGIPMPPSTALIDYVVRECFIKSNVL